MFGAPNVVTPLRYHTDYRQFFCVTSGKIHVRMTPWKNTPDLNAISDYEHYEFRSLIHPYDAPQKCKFLEFDVFEGSVFYIPPYWWYSIQYSEHPDTFVYNISYSTLMNNVANLPNLGLYWLQQLNITKRITKIPVQEKEVDQAKSKEEGDKEDPEKEEDKYKKEEVQIDNLEIDVTSKMTPLTTVVL